VGAHDIETEPQATEIDSREDAVRAEMDAIAVGYLRALTIAFSVYYTLRGLSYLFTFPEDVAALLGWPALAGAAYSVGLYYWTRHRASSRMLVESAVVSLGALLIFNVFWNFHLTGNQVQFVNAAFAMIAVGLGTATFWVWLVQILACLVIYTAIALSVELEPWVPIVGLVLSGVVLSLLAFVARAPVMRERVKLQLILEEQAKSLRQASKNKDRFVANMTHELRTPLTGVMGMMDLLQESKLDEDQQFLLGSAHKSAHYLLDIVNDVLDFSKLEAGKLELNRRPVDLLLVCREAVALFDAQAEEQNLYLNLKVPDLDVLLVEGDGFRIGQILINFIGNALKFTTKGGIDVELEWVPIGSKGYAKFSVTDTGIGIAADDAKKLFRRFEQVDNSSTRTSTGTGLGLAICRDLVDLMGGTIGVAGEPKKGSCFSFQVEMALADRPEDEEEAEGQASRSWRHPGISDLKKGSGEGAAAKKGRVLLAEDNVINQMLIVRMLELEGLDVTVADNGQQAVEVVHYAEEPFDLLFFDVQMPVMDGLSATRIIRLRMPKPPPIVAITANTLPSDIEDYKAAGMVAVLEKPVKRDELRQVIADLLGAQPEMGARKE